MTRVLVTGASGFIGSALVAALAEKGIAVRGTYRSTLPRPCGVEAVEVGDIGAKTDWRDELADVDAVVHLAGPAHARHAEPVLNAAIVDATSVLAAQAAAAGVSRFIYMSSIKAVADRTTAPISEDAEPAPADAYGRAKLKAERAVLAHASLRPVLLRPPLVYGAKAKANFRRLIEIADTSWPLPLGGLGNARSLISLDTLVACVQAVLANGAGPAGVFHLADRPALSTSEIVAALRRGLGRSHGLFRAPVLAALAPRQLTQSLSVDDARFRHAYGYAGLSDCSSVELLELAARDWKARQ